jgi:hypothetical protein
LKPPADRKRSKIKEDPLTSLPNIGKTTAAHLNKIGISTKEQFLSRDPYEVFDELLKKADPTLCRSALAGIVGASKGVRWHLVSKESAREFAKRHPDHVWGKCRMP